MACKIEDMKDIIRNERYEKKPEILKSSRDVDEKILTMIRMNGTRVDMIQV